MPDAQQLTHLIALMDDESPEIRDPVFAELAAMGGVGGVITAAPGPNGESEGGWHFNTVAMYRGLAKGDGTRRVAIYGDEG